MEPNVVTKVVTDEVGITAKVINGLENFAFNRGIDLLEAIIIFIVGYVICRYIRQGIIKILEKGKVDPSARSFVSEIAFFFCLAIVTIIALSTAGVAAGTLAVHLAVSDLLSASVLKTTSETLLRAFSF